MSHKQKGSLYVVVVFVLVVMGFLATTLTRIQWSDNDAHAKEVLGTQAWLLAQSVNEEMLTLFYPLNSSDSQVGSVCTTLPTSGLVDSDMKFDTQMNCRLVASSCRQVGELDEMKYYQLLARVSCGSGVSEVERTEEIWVRE
ncbi:MSHA biogenesis protein MshP [Vibrio ponticus]|nr:MSHA biogenesis protein MshP [Vibrio ponticus]